MSDRRVMQRRQGTFRPPDDGLRAACTCFPAILHSTSAGGTRCCVKGMDAVDTGLSNGLVNSYFTSLGVSTWLTPAW